MTVCLFQFFLPVSLSQAEVSPAGIGQVFLLFCLVIIYLGLLPGGAVDKSSNKLVWLVGGGFPCASAASLPCSFSTGSRRLSPAWRCSPTMQCHRRQRREPMRSKSGFPAGRIRQDGGDLQYHRTAQPNARPGSSQAGDRPVGREFRTARMAAVLAVLNILFALTGRLAKAGA